MRLVGIPPDAEAEDDFSLLPVGQFESHLQRTARVEAGSHLAREVRLMHGRRILQAAVAPDEFPPVAAHVTPRVIDVEERHALSELRAVGITRVERAGVGVEFGDHMHC